jgi:RNA polymerase sigma-70 factor (ECF subfamily)
MTAPEIALPDEAALIEQAKTDSPAFGELYQRYLGRIYSFVYHRTGNQADAEDLTERVFVQALTHLPRYTNRGLPFSVWLFRIAHNLVANWYRDQKRTSALPMDAVLAGDEETTAVLELVEDVAQLRRAMAQLPQDRQQLLLLKFTEDLSHAEIGKIMGRSEGAVKALLHRTLKALKEDMQGAEDGKS